MRAVTVMAVVIYHAFPSALHGGFNGLDILFVSSGYLISLVVLEDQERGRISFADIYSRRIRRIFPAPLVVKSTGYALGRFCRDGARETAVHGVPPDRDVGHYSMAGSMAGSVALGVLFNFAKMARETADKHWGRLP